MGKTLNCKLSSTTFHTIEKKTDKNKTCAIFISAFLVFSATTFLEGTDASVNNHNSQKINKLAAKFEEEGGKGQKIATADISSELASYGDLSIPIFEKNITNSSFESFFFSVQGLKQINSESSCKALIKAYYKIATNKESYDRIKYIIMAFEEINSPLGNQFINDILTGDLEYPKIFAAKILCNKERNIQAENILITLAPKYVEALVAISKIPSLILNRKNEIAEVSRNIALSTNNDLMRSLSFNNLARIGDQESTKALVEIFKSTKSERVSISIITALEHANTPLAKQTIINLSKDSSKSATVRKSIDEAIAHMK